MRRDGHIAEADDFDAYLVEIHVLAGHFREARDVAALPLVRLADRSTEVVVLTVRCLVAVAVHVDGDRGAIEALTAVLADARAAEATIEVARCLAALRVLSTDVDPA